MNKREVVYHLINSGIAGVLVLAGAVAAGGITWSGFMAACGAALVVFLTKFREQWMKHPPVTGIFCFI